MSKKTKGGDSTTEQGELSKYFVLGFSFFVVTCLIIHALVNQDTIDRNFSRYYFTILFLLVMIFIVSLNIGHDYESTVLFFKIVLGLGTIAYIAYLFTVFGRKIPYVTGAISTSLYIFGALILLAIASRSFLQYLSRMTGWYGFVAQLIFYIPCMLYDFVYYLLDQFQLTSLVVYVLIFLEIVVILLYFYLPRLFVAAVSDPRNSDILINEPVLLNKGKQTIAVGEKLQVPNQPNTYRHNYAISMWVYINPQNLSMGAYGKETEIFSYGFTKYKIKFLDMTGADIVVDPEDIGDFSLDPDNVTAHVTTKKGDKYHVKRTNISRTDPVESVKPMIRYYGGGNDDLPEERDKYVFYFSEYPPSQNVYDASHNSFYDISIPNQKWNHIVMNYNRNMVDIFINGNLERTFAMTNSLPEYSPLDTITVGDDNGLEGAICNVVYYHHPLSAEEVANSYNLFMNKNPPILVGTKASSSGGK